MTFIRRVGVATNTSRGAVKERDSKFSLHNNTGANSNSQDNQ